MITHVYILVRNMIRSMQYIQLKWLIYVHFLLYQLSFTNCQYSLPIMWVLRKNTPPRIIIYKNESRDDLPPFLLLITLFENLNKIVEVKIIFRDSCVWLWVDLMFRVLYVKLLTFSETPLTRTKLEYEKLHQRLVSATSKVSSPWDRNLF